MGSACSSPLPLSIPFLTTFNQVFPTTFNWLFLTTLNWLFPTTFITALFPLLFLSTNLFETFWKQPHCTAYYLSALIVFAYIRTQSVVSSMQLQSPLHSIDGNIRLCVVGFLDHRTLRMCMTLTGDPVEGILRLVHEPVHRDGDGMRSHVKRSSPSCRDSEE